MEESRRDAMIHYRDYKRPGEKPTREQEKEREVRLARYLRDHKGYSPVESIKTAQDIARGKKDVATIKSWGEIIFPISGASGGRRTKRRRTRSMTRRNKKN